jgi:hypothetical protein
LSRWIKIGGAQGGHQILEITKKFEAGFELVPKLSLKNVS